MRILALHSACVAGEFAKVKDMLIKHPDDYYVVNWLCSERTVLQSAILGGSLQVGFLSLILVFLLVVVIVF